ncbi:phosphoglycerol transferase MdoB-like AlkP superfamily enzyme [Lentzea atacamensis]|uniref:Phosphoglycerol transferase MdoB-like AlkP superfamily enzyme n=2 Tax=Lentzea TaxID=165301 RepID=A0A316HQ02_9PSEU|nr:sulfatase-like hydrolase/transferase [Lentzea atacamensis]PWK83333.1 phosphoglycerol transferase MdoB-like AlkP superfamily enzyme [Lentzea atacamensis]
MLLRRTATVLAGLFVLFVLIAPSDLEKFTFEAFLRVPLEGLIGVMALVLVPDRFRKPLAIAGGVALGLFTVVKIMDIGFDMVLYRPFDLVLDWPLLVPAVDFVDVTFGRVASVLAVLAAAAMVVGIVVLASFSVLRLSSAAAGRRPVAIRAVALTAVACVSLAVPGVPVYSDAAATSLVDHARRFQAGLQDQEAFAAEASVDAYRGHPGLLSSLQGKDVVFTFVESYGKSALDLPDVAAKLAQGNDRLKAAGYSARSAFLTSPTAGGGSWMAQATLLSGLWIDNQQRYRNLVASDRLTLPRAFREASWRSVGVVPGITQAWPEGNFFHYNEIYAAQDLGYTGPRFGYATTPDQFTLESFQRAERTGEHKPVMAAIPMVSSHAPWSPTPDFVDWSALGDGSIYRTMPASNDPPESIFGRDPAAVRADYGHSISYSLESVISYVERYGDENLVFVFLGDHQPAQMVTGEGASRDVPITIVAKDPAVLSRVEGWKWDDGIRPGGSAPVSRMSDFRDQFLSTFSPPRP